MPLHTCRPASSGCLCHDTAIKDDLFSYHANRLLHRHHGTGLPGLLFLLVLFSIAISINGCSGNISLNVFQGMRINVLNLHVINQQNFNATVCIFTPSSACRYMRKKGKVL